MDDVGLLRDFVIVYGAGLIVVFLLHKVSASPIAGFLITGLIVGPYGLGLVGQPDNVATMADLGVMLLLFSLGLEFSLKQMAAIRHVVLGGGALQVGTTALGVMIATRYLGIPFPTGLFIGLVVAMSGTTLALNVLNKRGEGAAMHARVALGVSIFQDLCIVPIIVIVPLLANQVSNEPIAWLMLKAFGVVVGTIVIARYVSTPILDLVASTRSKELFVISAVFTFLTIAWITSSLGFSLALGAFLAGLILSESEYSYQIFADMRPVRDSLNSLFFVAIGMLVNPAQLLSDPGLLILIVSSLIIGKFLVTSGSLLAVGVPLHVAVLAAAVLAQVGEFGFVLVRAGYNVNLIGDRGFQLLISSIVCTFLLCPPFYWVVQKIATWMLSKEASGEPAEGSDQWFVPDLTDHVIICGFGVSGRNLGRVLKQNDIPYMVLELNSRRVKEARAEGEPIFFGDCSSSAILLRAGIRLARVVVFAISDPFSTRRAVKVAHSVNPGAVILTRTKYLAEIEELYRLGSHEVIAEEFEASIEMMTRILRVYHLPRAAVAAEIKSIRDTHFGIFLADRHITVPRLRLSDRMELLIETVQVAKHSSFAGLSIAKSQLRKRSGASILGIRRGARTWVNPDPGERILGGDFLVLSGTKEQLKRAIAILGEEKHAEESKRDREPSTTMLHDGSSHAADQAEEEAAPEPSSRMSNG
jgi:monovalent cation:H+ antiporter-2, CPA2 family